MTYYDKPLCDWTLAEAKAECEKHGNECDGCPLDGTVCAVGYRVCDINYPGEWKLLENS